jgi:outer membrane protein assembly factor BamB
VVRMTELRRRVDGSAACRWLKRAVLTAVLLPALVSPTYAGDWPQLLGPDRNGHAAADERLADRWPAAGPPLVWKRDVGSGFAGAAVAGTRLVLFHRLTARQAGATSDMEMVEAIDASTGKTLWQNGHPTRFRPQVGGGDGPLCVPVIHDGMVVTYGAQGVLSCHALADGRRLWMHDTHRDYDAREGYFGAGSAPLVVGHGDQATVIVNVGGSREGAGVVAFRLADGELRWKATDEPASYAAPVAVPGPAEGELPDVIMITRYRCLQLDAVTGAVRWEVPFGMRGPTVNAASPLIMPAADGTASLLITASYGVGSQCGPFDATGFRPRWEGTASLATQYATPVLVGESLYAFDGREDVPPASLVCIDPATGEEWWREGQPSYGTVLAADGKLLAVGTDGTLQLIRPSAARLDVLATARPLGGTLRALPALANGRLYLRNDDTLICLDVGPRR